VYLIQEYIEGKMKVIFMNVVFTVVLCVTIVSSSAMISKAIKSSSVTIEQDVKSNYWEDPLLNSRVIMVTERISSNSAKRIISQLLYLETLEPSKAITIVLKSSGGSSSDCMAIMDAMRHISSPVNVFGIGRVSSSGSFILAAATGKRIISSESIVGIHMVFNKYDLTDDKSKYSYQKKMAEYTRSFWKKYAVLPSHFFPTEGDSLNKTFNINANEALNYGVVDEIADINKSGLSHWISPHDEAQD